MGQNATADGRISTSWSELNKHVMISSHYDYNKCLLPRNKEYYCFYYRLSKFL